MEELYREYPDSYNDVIREHVNIASEIRNLPRALKINLKADVVLSSVMIEEWFSHSLSTINAAYFTHCIRTPFTKSYLPYCVCVCVCVRACVRACVCVCVCVSVCAW